MSAASRLRSLFQPGRRRFLLPIALGIVVIALLGYWLYTAVAPSLPCSGSGVSTGSSGNECVNGVRFDYTTVAAPAKGQSASFNYQGVAFVVTSSAAKGSNGALSISGTEPNGYQYDLSAATSALVGGWTTTVSPDHSFGAQVQGTSPSTVRLMVAVGPNGTTGPPD